MTKLKSGEKLMRETSSTWKGRGIVVELHPGFLVLREKGTQRQVSLDYATAMECGYKVEALHARNGS
jgi:hypothetical protein